MYTQLGRLNLTFLLVFLLSVLDINATLTQASGIRESLQRRGHEGGSLYRSTGQNINGPNINELQINCSIGQQNPVDV